MEATYSATLLPDLIVTAISWEPNSPALGEEVTIAVSTGESGQRQLAGDGRNAICKRHWAW